MDRYTEIKSFVLVTEKGSFAAAALAEGVTPVIMGRRLDALEKRLGVKLMHRSTRGLTLTDLGQHFVEQCRQILRTFEEAENNVMSDRQSIRGHLFISAPASFGRRHVAPHAPQLQKRYPLLNFSFNFTDNTVDLVKDGYDMAVRIGEEIDPNYVAVHLYENRRVVCGTPEYFQKNGIPRTPEDLSQHNCLAFNLQGGQHHGWTFLRNGKTIAIRTNGNLNCNDGELLYDWVKQGLGLGWRSTWEIQAELKSGELITVLDEFAIPNYPIQAIYQQQQYLPMKVRFFIDYLKSVYNSEGYWDTPRYPFT